MNILYLRLCSKFYSLQKMTTFTELDRKRILESLTSEDLATLKEAFTVYDKNNDGTITTKVCISGHHTHFCHNA